MKNKIKAWLRKFLGVDELDRRQRVDFELDEQQCKINESVGKCFEDMYVKIKNLEATNAHYLTRLGERIAQQEDLIKHTRSLLYVGADINDPEYGGSWCVVSAKAADGKYDYVNCFEIRFEDYKELKKILEQFADMKTAYDLPHPLGGLKPFQF